MAHVDEPRSSAADVFFDDEKILVVGLTSPKGMPWAHPDRLIDLARDATDQQIVDAVRDVWRDQEESELATEGQRNEEWFRVSDRFGHPHELVKEVHPYLLIKRIGVNAIRGEQPQFDVTSVNATRRSGRYRKSIKDGRSRLDISATDEELAAAIRKAMAATRT